MSKKQKDNYLKDPHDKFFESSFREIAIAKDHLESELPAELLEAINLDSLKLDTSSYIDDTLKRYFSDVVYSAECAGTDTVLKVAFLYEHKSYTVPHPHLQLLQYMLNIWRSVEKDDKSAPFPVVIPLIVYHGEKEWKMQPFTSYFGDFDEVLRPYIPAFDYILSDCASYSVEELKEHRFKTAALKLVMYLFKTIFNLEKLEKDFDFFLNLANINIEDKQEKQSIFNRMIMYVYANIQENSEFHTEKINEILTRTGVDMTVLERMITDSELKGELRGELRGKLAEKHDVLIRQLDKKFGLTSEEKEYIKSVNDVGLLDSAIDEILFADNKNEVLACLKH